MERVLIVEDDINVNALLRETLQREGISCEQAFSGTEGRMRLENEEYSLVLLDLMLPGMSGEELLKWIRQKGNTPVIVLTAKDMLDEKVDLLSKGADDYITKPFEIKEVVARVRVQLRHAKQEPLCSQLTFKNMILDETNHEVFINEMRLPNITKQEFAILELLFKNPKRVFSKEDIFEYAWEQQYMGETKTLDVHISNIRKKIKKFSDQEYIETVWGIGYRLAH